MILALFALLAPDLDGYGTGLELMPILSVVIPIVLLMAIIWFGSRNTV